MQKVLILIGKLAIIAVVTVSMVVFLLNAENILSLRFTEEEDRSDYAAVAKNFIMKSGFINNKNGKVTSLNHMGRGGESNKESFNVFKVFGEEKNGVCNLTLARDEKREWYVTSADILISGKNYRVPVKRSTGDKWEGFKLK